MSKTKLIIARHGNTFGPGDTPTRIGARTDLPLSASGIEQAHRLGQYLREHSLLPDYVYSAQLLRTKQTAEHALPDYPITELQSFNEIDYGPDENKTEEEVIRRIGKHAIEQWNRKAIVPPGWKVTPNEIIKNWFLFAEMIKVKHAGKNVLVVTSNGIARFAPHLTVDFSAFCLKHDIKLKTGALGILTHSAQGWQIDSWNIKP